MRNLRVVLRVLWRSAITGRFVSRRYARKHPDTTTRETRTP